MATNNLINLGISPDSGTGDSARRGGEKINTLFSDIYNQFGDAPVNQDPSLPHYGYRRPFLENEYKVGELHPAGRFIQVQFSSTAGNTNIVTDSTYGLGRNGAGTMIDTDGDGVPDIYGSWRHYFFSRGEQIDADLSQVADGDEVHFILPVASPGDTIVARDWNGTWKDKNINVWATPFEFASDAQTDEWITATSQASAPDSEHVHIMDALTTWDSDTDTYTTYNCSWKQVTGTALYPSLQIDFAAGAAISPIRFESPAGFMFTFIYRGYSEGWVVAKTPLWNPNIMTWMNEMREWRHNGDIDGGTY